MARSRKTKKPSTRKRSTVASTSTSATSQGRLPAELVGKVLGNLDGHLDKSTLASCMRVSPMFNRIAAARLYRCITIESGMKHHPFAIPPRKTSVPVRRSTPNKHMNLNLIQGITVQTHDGDICEQQVGPMDTAKVLPFKVKWLRVDPACDSFRGQDRDMHQGQMDHAQPRHLVRSDRAVGRSHWTPQLSCGILKAVRADYIVFADTLELEDQLRFLVTRVKRIITVVDVDKTDRLSAHSSWWMSSPSGGKNFDEIILVLRSKDVDSQGQGFPASFMDWSDRQRQIYVFVESIAIYSSIAKTVTVVNAGPEGATALKAKLADACAPSLFPVRRKPTMSFITMRVFLDTYDTERVFTEEELQPWLDAHTLADQTKRQEQEQDEGQ